MFSSMVHLILNLSISYPYLIKCHDFVDNSEEGMKHQMRGATQAQQGMTLQRTLSTYQIFIPISTWTVECDTLHCSLVKLRLPDTSGYPWRSDTIRPCLQAHVAAFGSQDLGFRTSTNARTDIERRKLSILRPSTGARSCVLSFSCHFSLRRVVTDRRTHVTPSLFSASSGHRQTHAHNKRNYIEDCVWHWWVFGRICNKLLVRFVDGSFFKELPLEHDPKHSSTGWTCPLTILGRGELYFILEDTSTHFEMPCTRWS
jgi:hypothetical protein